MSDKRYWLALHLVNGIGSSRLRGIHHYFRGDMAAAWNAAPDEIARVGIEQSVVDNFIDRRNTLNVDGAYRRLNELGIQLCTLDDDYYPSLLREIHDAPPLIYHIGDLLPTDMHSLAIVGTRNATYYGRDVAQEFAYELAQRGLTIISGLAFGIDAAAHLGALEAGGRTIAVQANGLDEIYPDEHKALAERIVQNGGALLSEYPPKTPPDGKHFPVRNRLISGLSLGVLVVEAPESSGALHTASAAVEQNRDVFAVPGQIIHANSYGPHRLIQDGAKLVMNVDDILDELNLGQRTGTEPAPRPKRKRKRTTRVKPTPMPDDDSPVSPTPQSTTSQPPADEIEALIVDILSGGALHLDEIAFRSQFSVQEINAKLIIMVIKGMVKEVGIMTYQLN